MVSSVAVLTDVHGALPMLEAVLDEPEVATADTIVIAGDHASGPQPVERAVLARGNADREFVALANGQSIEIPEEITAWAAEQLSQPCRPAARPAPPGHVGDRLLRPSDLLSRNATRRRGSRTHRHAAQVLG